MTVIDILNAARNILAEMAGEVRSRCADTTNLRLQGVIQSLETAITLAGEAVAHEPAADNTAFAPSVAPTPAPAPELPGLDAAGLSQLLQVLGDRIASEVRAALDEARAAAPAAPAAPAPAPQG